MPPVIEPVFSIPSPIVLSSTIEMPNVAPPIEPELNSSPPICESARMSIAMPPDEIMLFELKMSPNRKLSLIVRFAPAAFIARLLKKLSCVVPSRSMVASRLIVTLTAWSLTIGP